MNTKTEAQYQKTIRSLMRNISQLERSNYELTKRNALLREMCLVTQKDLKEAYAEKNQKKDK